MVTETYQLNLILDGKTVRVVNGASNVPNKDDVLVFENDEGEIKSYLVQKRYFHYETGRWGAAKDTNQVELHVFETFNP